MNSGLLESAWEGLAISQAMQIALLFVLVWIVNRWLSPSRPHVAQLLWILILIKCVTPPIWTSPTGIFCWLARGAPWTANPSLSADSPSGVAIVFTQPSTIAGEPWPSESDRVEDSIAGSPRLLSQFLPPMLLAIWIAGTTMIISGSVYRVVQFQRRLWRNAVVVDRSIEQGLLELQRRIGVRRSVRLLITASRVGPAVCGLWRPTIVLPEIITRGKNRAQLEPILAHELIHIRRADLWLGALQTVACGLWWFHPLVWLSVRLSSRNAEYCCDEEVLGEMGYSPARYARALLDVLELKHKLSPVPAFPGVRPVEITSQRLERIMKRRQGCRRRPWWSCVLFLGLAAATLPGGAWLAARAEDQAKPWPALPLAKSPPSDRYTGAEEGKAVLIEMAMVVADSKVVNRVVGDWRLSPMNLEPDEQLLDASKAVQPDKQATVPETSTQAITSIQKQLPFQFRIVNDDEQRRILESLQQDRNTDWLSRPKVMTLEGVPAIIQMESQRPFVVAIKDGQPQIRICREGCLINLLPRRISPDEFEEPGKHQADKNRARSVQLGFSLEHSQILKVTTSTIRVAGQKEPVTLQVPEVRTSKLASTITVPLNRTLIAGSVPYEDGKKPARVLLAILTVREPPVATGESDRDGREVHEEPSAESPVLPEPLPPAWRKVKNSPTAILKTYPVADLVIPLPGNVKIDVQREQLAPAPAQDEYVGRVAEFDPLIDLIQQTISPDSWDSAHGKCSIEPFPTSLSLVVRAPAEVHEKIAELLERLRRLLEFQVAMDTRLFGVSAEMGDRLLDPRQEESGLVFRVLNPDLTRELLQTFGEDRQSRELQLPKVTVFNGQAATYSLGSLVDCSLRLQPRVSADRRSINIDGNLFGDDSKTHQSKPITIAMNHSVLIDVTGPLAPRDWATIGLSAPLKTSPWRRLIGYRQDESDMGGNRTLLLVTPRVIVVEEEEAHLPK